jgi:hypothetical protein
MRTGAGVKEGLTGCVVFVQRFGSGGNLNLHFHIVALDGVYEQKSTGRLKFYPSAAPTQTSISLLVCDIAKRMNDHLVKKGYLEEVEGMPLVGNTDALFDTEENLHLPAQAASVGNRIAFGENAGKPIRRLRSSNSSWPDEDELEVSSTACVTSGGYSVHAATAVKDHERERLERLVRYMARPAIADERITITDRDEIRLRLKTPWRDGTEFLLFSPTEMIEKLIALIPQPGFHMVRYFGVLAARSQHRANLPDLPQTLSSERSATQKSTPRKKRGKRHIKWAELLKRTFKVDVLVCPRCQTKMELMAIIHDPATIHATLVKLGLSPRAPPITPPRLRGVFSCEPVYESNE